MLVGCCASECVRAVVPLAFINKTCFVVVVNFDLEYEKNKNRNEANKRL